MMASRHLPDNADKVISSGPTGNRYLGNNCENQRPSSSSKHHKNGKLVGDKININYNRFSTQSLKSNQNVLNYKTPIGNKMVGGVLLAESKLLENVSKVQKRAAGTVPLSEIVKFTPNKCSSLSKSHNDRRIFQTDTSNKKPKLSSEIDDLINRKSSHSDEASDEWYASFSSRMQKLSNKEEYLSKESEIDSMMIKAFECVECQFLSETPRQPCIDSKHHVQKVQVRKRFYECNICGRKGSTLGKSKLLTPAYPCVCGNVDWRACGRKTIGGERTPLNPTMILTASETTKRKDIDTVKCKASDL